MIASVQTPTGCCINAPSIGNGFAQTHLTPTYGKIGKFEFYPDRAGSKMFSFQRLCEFLSLQPQRSKQHSLVIDIVLKRLFRRNRFRFTFRLNATVIDAAREIREKRRRGTEQ